MPINESVPSTKGSYLSPSIFDLADMLRGKGLSSFDALIPLACLIILRWADLKETEREVQATLDESPYHAGLPTTLRWSHLRGSALKSKRNWDEVLIEALIDFQPEKNNFLSDYLYRLADSLDRVMVSSEVFALMLQWLDAQHFETLKDRLVLLQIFDEFIEFTGRRGLGQFTTPPCIAKLMVALSAPQPGERVYDPCFGMGGLLTAAGEYLRGEEQGSTYLPADQSWIAGIEKNIQPFIIGFARLLLAGVEAPHHLQLGNSLSVDNFTNDRNLRYDVVLANPPWGTRLSSEEIDRNQFPTKDVTTLFLLHALAKLQQGGRVSILVPQGWLSKGGGERQFRQWLTSKYAVEAVIALPSGAFLPYAQLKTSILLIRNSGPSERIRMIDAEVLFEGARQSRGQTISDLGIAEIVQSVKRQSESKIGWDEDIDTIAGVEWDLTPQRRTQSGLKLLIQSLLEKQVEISSLGDVCQVFGGLSVKWGDLTDSATADTVSYIRIKDIRKGLIGKGSSWITQDILGRLDHRALLRIGDLLLSKSGTIGKVGIVGEGAAGAVPANGFYVIRPETERLNPHYLLAVLSSSECRAWFSDQARGAVIQHLSVSVIRELPLPLPSLEIQKQIADQFREQETDALGLLALLMGSSKQDPIGELIEAALTNLPSEGEPISDPLNFVPIERLVNEIRSFRNSVVHGKESQLKPWIVGFAEALSHLKGIQSIPRGPGLLSILQETARSLEKAQDFLGGPLPLESRALRLTIIIRRMVLAAIAALAEDIQVIVMASESNLIAGREVEVELKISNEGTLPLRTLRVATLPNWGVGEISYLAEQGSFTVTLAGLAPEEEGSFDLKVLWSALTLGGRPIQDERQIAFAILRENKEEADVPDDLGPSPYVCGDPVRPERDDVFFGREDLLDRIRRTVTRSGNVVLLEGNRRAGKSSILTHLAGRNGIPGWLGVHCSLQGAEGSKEAAGVPTVAVFRVIAESIAKAIQSLGIATPLPNGSVLAPQKGVGISKACREGISEHAPFSDLSDYVEVVLSTLKQQDLGLLLMLDEFDKLQEGIDNKVTSPQVPENIRYLIQTHPRFSAILTGSRRLKRLREEYWSALFGLGTREGVTALDAYAARRLVTDPVKGRLTYSKEAVDYVVRVTACQPYILQCLCNRIFDEASNLKIRSVNLDHVSQAARELIKGWEHFASLWDYAQTDRRRFILCICHRESKDLNLITFLVLQEHLIQHGIEVSEDALITDVEFLTELEMLELVGAAGTGQYRLAIPLMGEWMDLQQDFDMLRVKARRENEDEDA